MKQIHFSAFLFLCVFVTVAANGQSLRNTVRSLKLTAEHRAFLSNLPNPLTLQEQMVAMPDGVQLATDIYIPEGGAARKPVILVRLPYGKRFYGEALRWVNLFSAQDYAVVVQDMRGRHRSEGVFAPYPNEGPDGYATLDWISEQPFSTGSVGTIGCSALGETQILLAAERHPAHRAMIPMGAGGAIGTADQSYGFFGFFDGGILTLASGFGWFVSEGGKTGDAMWGPNVDYAQALKTLPAVDSVATFRNDQTDFEDLLHGFDDPEAHTRWGFISDDAKFAIPSLIVDGWYDQAVSSSLSLNDQIGRSGTPHHVIIAPSTHCLFETPFYGGLVGDIPVATDAALAFDALYLSFMDHHLKGAPPPAIAPFTSFVMNENSWLESEKWPPLDAKARRIYLTEETLTETKPSRVSSRELVANPSDPVPTLGGAICCTGDPNSRSGPLIQNPIETRNDLIIYTSSPLQKPLTIAGPLTAHLNVSSSHPDSDLVLRLTDVTPAGTSVMIQEGALRLRYRDGFQTPNLMKPQEIYSVDISMHDIAYTLPAGHRLRLHIAGSSFPRLARNMNTGGVPHEESKPETARALIHSGPTRESYLTLFELQR